MDIGKVDLMIHAAGMNAQDCLKDPLYAKDFNGNATKKLIKACIQYKINNFLFLSTAHVYKQPLEGVISETSPLTNSHPYATSNVIGESYTIRASHSAKLRSKVLRLSNCFGYPLSTENDCWNLLVNDICLKAIKEKKIKLHSDGAQLRDFIPISETCRTLDFIFKNCMEDKDFDVFNLGGKTFTISQMAEIVSNIYYEKFKVRIPIIKKEIDNDGKPKSLEYKMNWIKKYNYKKVFDPYYEIVNLIDFCHRNMR